MTEDLLRDLALYKKYKEKSVMMAARSLISLYREQLPDLLHKKDRGRPTEATAELKAKKYGEVQVTDTIAGAEALLKAAPTLQNDKRGKKRARRDSSDSEGSESGSDWEDVEHSDGEAAESDEASESDGSWEEVDDDEEDAGEEAEEEKKEPKGRVMDEKEAVKEIALTRIFTDEDFARIESELVKKKVTNARKRPLEKQEYVKLDDIEMIYKKRRTDKEARVESMVKGREGREKFGYKDGRQNIHCSKTNREKRKTKNFQMVRAKARGKVKKSFRDKQLKLRKHLIQQRKMK